MQVQIEEASEDATGSEDEATNSTAAEASTPSEAPAEDALRVTSSDQLFGSAAEEEPPEPKLSAAERAKMREDMRKSHIHSRVGSNLHAKLLENPATARRMKDPGFLQMVNNVQVKPRDASEQPVDPAVCV